MRTRLLVSVRDAGEAGDALAAGVDLIDIKEPRRGALGAVDRTTMQDVVTQIAGQVPLSAALGELIDCNETPTIPRGISLAKYGLAGCGNDDSWRARFATCVAALPASVGAVAVIYADWQSAVAPSPADVLAVAAIHGCRAVLVDTWDKSRGGLLDLWDLAECRDFIQQVQACGAWAVLGGSLNADAIALLLPLAPDVIAVRGAACDGQRTDRISPARIDRLRECLATPAC